MKKHKISLLLILLILMASLSMTGCSPVLPGSTVVGDCTLNVAFLNVLTEGGEGTFHGIDDDIRNQVEISIELQNIITERRYFIKLNQGNSYIYTAKMNPGIYRIVSVDGSMNKYTGMHLSAGAETVELKRDVPSNLSIYIDNKDEFMAFQENLVADTAIVTSGRFSRNIWIDKELVNIQNIASHLEISDEREVKPYAKCEVRDDDKGVTVIYLNDSSEGRSWRECKVIGISIDKSSVLFPGGITLGMKTETVCNKDTGLYGQPSEFEGVAIYGLPVGGLRAVYKDSASGDKLSIDVDSDDGYITGITYEIEVFE